jgi:hypothetical protein
MAGSNDNYRVFITNSGIGASTIAGIQTQGVDYGVSISEDITTRNVSAVSVTANTLSGPLTVTVNEKLTISAPVDQNVVDLGTGTAIDCSQGNYFKTTVNGNVNFTFTNVPSGVLYGLMIEITHISGTISWPVSVKFPEDVAPSVSTDKTHLFMFVTDDAGARFRGASLYDYEN